jgi:hypothetical protein
MKLIGLRRGLSPFLPQPHAGHVAVGELDARGFERGLDRRQIVRDRFSAAASQYGVLTNDYLDLALPGGSGCGFKNPPPKPPPPPIRSLVLDLLDLTVVALAVPFPPPPPMRSLVFDLELLTVVARWVCPSAGDVSAGPRKMAPARIGISALRDMASLPRLKPVSNGTGAAIGDVAV